jgi:hypothetical protein
VDRDRQPVVRQGRLHGDGDRDLRAGRLTSPAPHRRRALSPPVRTRGGRRDR